jgi:hypothetical protein
MTNIERRKGETLGDYSSRCFRRMILEEAASDLERQVSDMTRVSAAFRMGYSSAAQTLRKMAEE